MPAQGEAISISLLILIIAGGLIFFLLNTFVVVLVSLIKSNRNLRDGIHQLRNENLKLELKGRKKK